MKNSKAREIYISDDLEAAYSRYVWELVDAGIDLDIADLSTHFVFVNLARAPLWQPLAPGTVYDKVAAITKAHPDLLPGRWSPHWLRHTHATALQVSGIAVDASLVSFCDRVGVRELGVSGGMSVGWPPQRHAV